MRKNFIIAFSLISIVSFMILFDIHHTSSITQKTVDEGLDIDSLIPEIQSSTSTAIPISSMYQSYLENYLTKEANFDEVTNLDAETGIETITQLLISSSRIPNFSYQSSIESLFNSIIETDFMFKEGQLLQDIDNKFIINNVSHNIYSTNVNINIARGLVQLSYGSTDNITYLQNAANIYLNLNDTLRSPDAPYFFHEFSEVNGLGDIIPATAPELLLLENQVNALIFLIEYLETGIDTTFSRNLPNDIDHFLTVIYDSPLGFITTDTDDIYLHSARDINTVWNSENSSILNLNDYLIFLTALEKKILLEELNDPTSSSEFYRWAEELILLIQNTFYNPSIGYYEQQVKVDNKSLVTPHSDLILIKQQFQIQDHLLFFPPVFKRLAATGLSVNVPIDQYRLLALSLYTNLIDNALEKNEDSVGVGASITGRFYSYYSTTLGTYLFSLTPGTNYLTNLLGYLGLGTIFPYSVNLDFLNQLTVREEQLFNLTISSDSSNSSLSINNIEVYVDVPRESIANVKIGETSVFPNTPSSLDYSWDLVNEGEIQFTVTVVESGTILVELSGSFIVLKSMKVDVLINPISPNQGETIKIFFEIRDDVGLIKKDVNLHAIIRNSTSNGLIIANYSLFILQRAQWLTIDQKHVTSNLECYFIITKENYYPYEINTTIPVKTGFNLLISVLVWLLFESELGTIIGVLFSVLTFSWQINKRFIRRMRGKIASCPHCGSNYEKKYFVCSSCGRHTDIHKV